MRNVTLGLLVVLALYAGGASAGHHKIVAGDALQVKECYILRAPRTPMWNHRHFKKAGAWSVREGGIICVDRIDRSGPRLWYKVRIMKPGTLDRSQHIPVWVDSRELVTHGVYLAH